MANELPMEGQFRKESGQKTITEVYKQDNTEEPKSTDVVPSGFDPINEHIELADDDAANVVAKADVKAYEAWRGTKLEHDDDFERADKTDDDTVEEQKLADASKKEADDDSEITTDQEDIDKSFAQQEPEVEDSEPEALKKSKPRHWLISNTGEQMHPPTDEKTEKGSEISQAGEVEPTITPKAPGESDDAPGPGDDPGAKNTL